MLGMWMVYSSRKEFCLSGIKASFQGRLVNLSSGRHRKVTKRTSVFLVGMQITKVFATSMKTAWRDGLLSKVLAVKE